MSTQREIGVREPGFQEFARFYRRQGTTDRAIEEYAAFIGAVRGLSQKPLLELDVRGVEDLDEKLLSRAKTYRVVLRMFYNANKKYDLREAMPRQRRPKKRRLSMDDILMPEDVTALIGAATNLRDRALVMALFRTGGRINEVLGLRLGDIKKSNGGYQAWFGRTKTRGHERYSSKIDGPWKVRLDEWVGRHPSRSDAGAWLFPSTKEGGEHIKENTVRALLVSLRGKAGLSKKVNPHWLRHSRISLAFATREADTATICTWFWGVPVTTMANLYSHFQGLEMTVGRPEGIDLPPVPALPTPPILATQDTVQRLTTEVEVMRGIVEELLKRDRLSDPKKALALLETIKEKGGGSLTG